MTVLFSPPGPLRRWRAVMARRSTTTRIMITRRSHRAAPDMSTPPSRPSTAARTSLSARDRSSHDRARARDLHELVVPYAMARRAAATARRSRRCPVKPPICAIRDGRGDGGQLLVLENQRGRARRAVPVARFHHAGLEGRAVDSRTAGAVIAYQHTFSGHRGPHVTSEHPQMVSPAHGSHTAHRPRPLELLQTVHLRATAGDGSTCRWRTCPGWGS